jgi:hypothetical protein
MTSLSASWICAVTSSGLAVGSSVTACRTLSVWVPARLDHDAISAPFISRSSDRGYVLFFVVTPPASAVNTTPSPRASTWKNRLL